MSKEQRKFLHDIASPMTIAMGMLDSALESLQKTTGVDPVVINKLKKSASAMERMAEMIRVRRSEIVAMEKAEASGNPSVSAKKTDEAA